MKNINLKLEKLKSLLLLQKSYIHFKKKSNQKKKNFIINDRSIPRSFDFMSIQFLNHLLNPEIIISSPDCLVLNWFCSKKRKIYPKSIFLFISEKNYLKVSMFSNYSNCGSSRVNMFLSNKKKKNFKPEERIFVHFCSQLLSKMKKRGFS